jgi:hypothetical protein
MMDLLFAGPGAWFTGPALLGTGFLLLQLIMGEIGAELDAEIDDPGADAKWLSLQSAAAFFVGFGWMGLAALRLFNLPFGAAALIGVASGVGVAWMMVRITGALLGLQSDANVRLDESIGLEGTVTVMIPPSGSGSGRITLVINQSQHELPAVQHGDEPIGSHTPVRVTQADEAAGAVTVQRV